MVVIIILHKINLKGPQCTADLPVNTHPIMPSSHLDRETNFTCDRYLKSGIFSEITRNHTQALFSTKGKSTKFTYVFDSFVSIQKIIWVWAGQCKSKTAFISVSFSTESNFESFLFLLSFSALRLNLGFFGGIYQSNVSVL